MTCVTLPKSLERTTKEMVHVKLNEWRTQKNPIESYFGQKNAPNKRIRFMNSPLFTDFSISRNE